MTEEQLQKQIIDYIKLQYPKAMFKADLNGIKLTAGQAAKLAKQKSDRGFPDIEILQTAGKKLIDVKLVNGEIVRNVVVFQFAGLFLEVKKETPFKKNGELKSGEHLREQNEIHKRLRKQGYCAVFVWSFDMAKNVIDDYLSL